MISSDDLRFIVALAQSNSLAAASRALNVTPSAVTQRLQSMEERIGFRLVDRSSRRMVLTDEGDKLANGGQRVLEELGDLIDTLNSRRAEVSGHLRIVAPLGFGRRYVAPAATQFRLLFPNVTVSLMLFDRPAHRPLSEQRGLCLVHHRRDHGPHWRLGCVPAGADPP